MAGQAANGGRGNKVIAAIDIGTTYSGYAYSVANGKDEIYLMRKYMQINF